MLTLTDLACPFCKSPLIEKNNTNVACQKCAQTWRVHEGVPVICSSGSEVFNRKSESDFSRFLKIAETRGWKVSLFEYAKAISAAGGSLEEDLRIVDWQYFLPLSNRVVALILGCGLGTVSVALSEVCKKVYAVDTDWDKISFLNIRKKQQNLVNLHPIYVESGDFLPFPDGYFDLITMRQFKWESVGTVPFRNIIRRLRGLLAEEGRIFIGVENRLTFQSLLGLKKENMNYRPHTLFGYRKILQEEQFSDVEFFAPLPHYLGLIMFYLPLKDNRALDFFLSNIFPLFETVTPDVKKKHGLQYSIAKLGVKLTLIFKAAGLAKMFLPGFYISARKRGESQDDS
jgi:SAM-dependent methyltransferase